VTPRSQRGIISFLTHDAPDGGAASLAQVLDARVREGELIEKLPDGAVRCFACGHRCLVKPGRRGICKVRFNRDGALLVPAGYVAALQCDPTEKKPFFHCLPGSDTLTFGMLGCDFHCGYCQNWLTSQALRDDTAGVLPTDLVLLDLFHSGPDSATVSVPAGWTQVPGSPVKASYGQTWRFVETNVDAATAAPLVTFSTAHRVMAVTYAFRYASGIGPSASTADPVIDTDPTPVLSTLRTAGQLLVVGDGERVAAPPNPTVTPGAGFTERTETSTTQTSFGGGTLELATKPVTTTGTAGGELFQSSVAARDMLIVTALNPSR